MATEKGTIYGNDTVLSAITAFERRVELTEGIPATVEVQDVHIYRQKDNRFAVEYEFEFQFKREKSNET